MDKSDSMKMDGSELSGIPVKKRSRAGKAGANFWIDSLAFLTLVMTTVSGWVLMVIGRGGYGHGGGSLSADVFWGITRFEWEHLHNLIGWIFVALMVLHLAMHRHWIIRMCSGVFCLDRSDRK